MTTKATPRWLKHLRIGVITGILLGITGLIADASWLTWGFLYAPALSLTNKAFWGVIWKMLGAKDGDNSSSSSQRLDDEDDSSFDLREEDKGNHYHSHYHGHY